MTPSHTGAAGTGSSSGSQSPQWSAVTLGSGALPPAGPYSPAVRAGAFVFVSGQVPRDPLTGELTGGGVTEQSERVLSNLVAVLAAAGAGPQHVVSVTVYLADEQDWAEFNEVYKSVFTAPYPSRTAVGARLRGILVEVSAVAYVGDGVG